MNKLLIILLLCFLPSTAYGALATATEWIVRTDGSDNNGGCFDPAGSTDYTNQAAAQLTLTDLAQTATSTTLTSSTGGFTAAMVGNCIQITEGTNFTTGFYQITVHTDSNTVTIDRTACSVSDCSSGTGRVGGGLLTLEKVDDFVAAGHKVYIKDGTYTETLNLETAGTKASPIHWFGYASTKGDNPTGTTRPLVDCQSSRANGLVFDQSYNILGFVRVANCTGDGISVTASSQALIYVQSNSNAGDGIESTVGMTFVSCEVQANTVDGFNITPGSGSMIVASRISDNTHGVDTSNSSGTSVGMFNVIDGNSSSGFRTGLVNQAFVFGFNTLDNNGTGFHQHRTNSTDTVFALFGNIFTSNTTGATKQNDYGYGVLYRNNFSGNTAKTSGTAWLELDSGALDPSYVDAANEDFNIGTALKDFYPHAANNHTGFDLGAVPRDEGSGSTATTAYTFTG